MSTSSGQVSERRSRYWTEAKVARDQGRIAQALNLYAKATAVMPTAHEVCYEAGTFALEVNRNLAGLDELYDRHRKNFGLSAEECPVRVAGTKLGPEGWEFGIDCLTRANAFPVVPAEWHETLADALASRGRLSQALQWRRRLNRRDPMRRGNRLTMARLCEALGSLEDAARQYEELLNRWPDDPESILGLTWIQEQLGQVVETARLVDLFESAWREASAVDVGPPEMVAGRVLRVVWAAAKRGSKRLPTDARHKLRELGQALRARHPGHPTCLLAEGYVRLIDGEAIVARQKFLLASLAIAGGVVIRTNSPPHDAALHDALHWARALLVDPGLDDPQEGPLPSFDAAALERVHAHEMWAAGQMIAAMSGYATALRLHHVANVPLQYEIRGEYKVLFHEGLFYAVPRKVSEFTIIDGKVYRLKGRARDSERRLPPWLIDLAYWIAGALHCAGRHVGPLRTASRPVVRFGQFVRRIWSHPMAARAKRLVWMVYAVKGVVVATSLEQLITLIDRDWRDH